MNSRLFLHDPCSILFWKQQRRYPACLSEATAPSFTSFSLSWSLKCSPSCCILPATEHPHVFLQLLFSSQVTLCCLCLLRAHLWIPQQRPAAFLWLQKERSKRERLAPAALERQMIEEASGRGGGGVLSLQEKEQHD